MASMGFMKLGLKRQTLEVVGFIAIMLTAALTRLWNLGYPPKLVFDETYYVKDALTLATEGHEKSWPDGANQAFESGDVYSYLNESAFVVHPPLGKWLIAFGMIPFGPESSFSWRLSVAVIGILTVALLVLVALKLFQSRTMALVAGLFMAVDGLAIVLSRTALLDGILTFFLLLGFYFFLFDQASSRVKITRAIASGKMGLLWFRPWLMLAGLSLGLATSVKWSGLYLLAALGLYVVFSETFLRRRSEQSNWSVVGVAYQGLASFLNLVPIAVVAYLSTWLGWVVSPGGYARSWAEENQLPGIFGLLPNWLQSLWHYHEVIYRFHINLTTEHNYAAHPIGWLIGLRPTAFFYESLSQGEGTCQSLVGCSSAITALGNPLIWIGGTLALGFLLVRYLRLRERVVGLVLLGVAALYLPWLLLSSRTVFQFYSISFLPWVILALVLVLRLIHGKLQGVGGPLRNLVPIFIALVLIVAFFFLPIYLGTWIPFDLWQLRMWLASWI